MKQRAEGLDAGIEQPIDQPIVECESGSVDLPATVGQHARPRDAEAIGLQPDLPHQGDVLAIAMVVIAGNLPAVPFEDRAGARAEDVPRARTAPILACRALDSDRPLWRPPTRSRQERHTHLRRFCSWAWLPIAQRTRTAEVPDRGPGFDVPRVGHDPTFVVYFTKRMDACTRSKSSHRI